LENPVYTSQASQLFHQDKLPMKKLKGLKHLIPSPKEVAENMNHQKKD